MYLRGKKMKLVKMVLLVLFVIISITYITLTALIKPDLMDKQQAFDNLNGDVSISRVIQGYDTNENQEEEFKAGYDEGITIGAVTDPKIQEESLRKVLRNKGNLAKLLSERISDEEEKKEQDSDYQIDPKYLLNYVDIEFLSFGADEDIIQVDRQEITANVNLIIENNGEKQVINADLDFGIRQTVYGERNIYLMGFIT